MSEAGDDHDTDLPVGAELRAARENREFSLAQVAERTRIPLRHLAAIEQSDHAQLPAATYSAGFVRTYARLLGLDAHALSQRFRAELAQREPKDARWQESYAPADPTRVPSLGLALGGLLVALIAVLGFLYWRGSQIESPTEVAAASPGASQAASIDDNGASSNAAQPAVDLGNAEGPAADAPGSPVPSTAAPGSTAVLTASEPVWLRITEADGAKLFEGMLKAGDHYQVPASATDPRLRTGRATVLKVSVGATAIPPLGPPETLVKDVSLKPDALLARAGPLRLNPPR